MFEKLTDVPAPIAEFYAVETRQEPTGEQKEVERPGFDEEGNPTIATRLEPVYADVDYVLQVPVLERKALRDVWRVVALHAGKRDHLIRQFLAMVCRDTQWTFHDEYLTWYTKQLELQALAPIRAQYDNGQFLSDDPETPENEAWVLTQAEIDEQIQKHAQKEPVKPSKLCVDPWFLDNYYELRRHAYASPEKQDEMRFDDAVNGTTTWVDHIKAVKAQYPKPPELSDTEVFDDGLLEEV